MGAVSQKNQARDRKGEDEFMREAKGEERLRIEKVGADSQARTQGQTRSARWQHERGGTSGLPLGGDTARDQLPDPEAGEIEPRKGNGLPRSHFEEQEPDKWPAGKAPRADARQGKKGSTLPTRLANGGNPDKDKDHDDVKGALSDKSLASASQAPHVERPSEALLLSISTSSRSGALRTLLLQQDEDGEMDPDEMIEGNGKGEGDGDGHGDGDGDREGEGGGDRDGDGKGEDKERTQKCKGRYIYMYNLPPRFNQELLDNCERINRYFSRCSSLSNDAFGPLMPSMVEGGMPGGSLNGLPPINSLKGEANAHPWEEGEEGGLPGGSSSAAGCWHHTEQHTLEVVVHKYMREYACLTKDPDLADAFYLPFYPGLDAEQFLFGGASQANVDRLGRQLAALLRDSPMWQRRGGGDHFFAYGRVTWDFRRRAESSGWGVPLLTHPEVNATLRLTMERKSADSREFAVPYPTSFHPRTDLQVETWVRAVRARAGARTWRTSFVGRGRSTKSNTGLLRKELMRQCRAAESHAECRLLVCFPGKSSPCNYPGAITEVQLASDFCLQPPGDSAVRRSTFDALIAGCIPVFFDPRSAYTQYLWHLPSRHDSYSVFIPREAITNGSVNVISVLSSYSRARITSMRETILGLIPGLLYSNGRLRAHDDAMDITIRMLLHHIQQLKESLEW
eukprot:jgi/Mesen1/8680/ME000051S08081